MSLCVWNSTYFIFRTLTDINLTVHTDTHRQIVVFSTFNRTKNRLINNISFNFYPSSNPMWYQVNISSLLHDVLQAQHHPQLPLQLLPVGSTFCQVPDRLKQHHPLTVRLKEKTKSKSDWLCNSPRGQSRRPGGSGGPGTGWVRGGSLGPGRWPCGSWGLRPGPSAGWPRPGLRAQRSWWTVTHPYTKKLQTFRVYYLYVHTVLLPFSTSRFLCASLFRRAEEISL